MSAAPRPTARPTPVRDRDRTQAPLVVVPPPARHPLLWTVLSLLVLGAGVFGAVTFNALAAADAVEARQLQHRLTAAEIRYDQLVTEVAALESPARIAAAAAELGLVRAQNPRLLMLTRVLPSDGRVDAAVDGSGGVRIAQTAP